MTDAPSTLSDAELAARTGDVLAVPRTELNSFTLHAPLELLARAELMPLVAPDARDRARQRLDTLADIFSRSGEAIAAPPPLGVDDAAGALAALSRALTDCDVELADAAAIWLSRHLSAADIAAALAGPLVLEMGAAAHAPILFASYLRFPDTDTRPLRGVARRLVEYPDIRVGPEWLEPPGRRSGSLDSFESALGALVVDEEPGWGIFLLVAQVHRRGLMSGIPRVPDDEIDEGFRVLFRVAARSMLEDDPAHAPYGWSHALTIPLGILQTVHLHDRRREAFDVATILAAGFRGGHGAAPLGPAARSSATVRTREELASRASVQHDAHLVKYVLACFHAADLDPEYRALYLHAAEYLVEWWDANPPADDPLPTHTRFFDT